MGISVSEERSCVRTAVSFGLVAIQERLRKAYWAVCEIYISQDFPIYNKLFVFGPQGKHTIKGALENRFPSNNIYHGTKDKIAQKVLENINRDTWLLVKGSRGMAMETIIKGLQERLAVNSHKKEDYEKLYGETQDQ